MQSKLQKPWKIIEKEENKWLGNYLEVLKYIGLGGRELVEFIQQPQFLFQFTLSSLGIN